MEIVVVLHNVRSVHNVGSIFRTADASGVKKIYCCGITPTPLDRLGKSREDFVKVSLGAEKSVAWEYAKSTKKCFTILQKDGYCVCAVEQDARAIPYMQFSKKARKKKIALVLGNEIRGIPKGILDNVDTILEIPMHGAKESLNVSVSFGIVIYSLLY